MRTTASVTSLARAFFCSKVRPSNRSIRTNGIWPPPKFFIGLFYHILGYKGQQNYGKIIMKHILERTEGKWHNYIINMGP